MIVDSGKIGKIIGKGGCQIKQMQEQSGARINVSILKMINLFKLL